MKKIFLTLVAVLGIIVFVNATESNIAPSNSEAAPTTTETSMSAAVIYSGPAYPVADNDLIPRAGTPISIRWTEDGCYIDGDTYKVYKISGNFAINLGGGRVKYMTHYVVYNGENYYFQA